MQRGTFALGAAIAVLGLLPGCGGSKQQDTGVVTRQLQGVLVREVQNQMRTALHAKRFSVTGISCESGTSGVATCQLDGKDQKGATGTITLSVSVNEGAAQVQMTGTTNTAWNVALQNGQSAPATTVPAGTTGG